MCGGGVVGADHITLVGGRMADQVAAPYRQVAIIVNSVVEMKEYLGALTGKPPPLFGVADFTGPILYSIRKRSRSARTTSTARN